MELNDRLLDIGMEQHWLPDMGNRIGYQIYIGMELATIPGMRLAGMRPLTLDF